MATEVVGPWWDRRAGDAVDVVPPRAGTRSGMVVVALLHLVTRDMASVVPPPVPMGATGMTTEMVATSFSTRVGLLGIASWTGLAGTELASTTGTSGVMVETSSLGRCQDWGDEMLAGSRGEEMEFL